MKSFFISDTHLGGLLPNRASIFKTREKFIDRIISGINQRVKVGDRLYIVGDFVSYGAVGYTDYKGERIQSESLRLKAIDYLAQINTKDVILIAGNHCYNNHVKPHCVTSFSDVGKYLAFLSHYPTYVSQNVLFDFREQKKWHKLCETAAIVAQMAIVGHIHDAPKYTWDKRLGLVNINVAPEVNNWLPVSTEEIIRGYEDFIRQPR